MAERSGWLADIGYAILEVADIFGLGKVLDTASTRLGNPSLITTTDVNKSIDALIAAAKTKGSKVYNQILARLNNLTASIPNSSMNEKIIRLRQAQKDRNKLANVETNMQLADEKLNTARNNAARIDDLRYDMEKMDTTDGALRSKGAQYRSQALEDARSAASIYENIDKPINLNLKGDN